MHVLLLTTDLMVTSLATGGARESGASLETMTSADALAQRAADTAAQLVVVDLSIASLELERTVDALKSLVSPPVVLAYAPHVHEARLQAARAAGCDHVVSRGQLAGKLAELMRGR